MTERLKILVAGAGREVSDAIESAIISVGLLAEVVRVDDGEEAVRALGRWNYDCALLGPTLSGKDGLAVLREANKKGVDTPVILLTKEGNGSFASEILEAGLFDCLAKEDLDNGRLSRTLRNAVRINRAERQVSLADQLLRHQAMHDGLTGLPNRSLFDDRLDNVIVTAAREGKSVAVLVVDLNRFGEINKTLGHATGDMLLGEVSIRLQNAMRSSDTVARLAGDEFAVLLSTGASLKGAVSAAGKIISILKEPFPIGNRQIALSASIGVAQFPTHGADGTEIVRHAAMAMAEAKRNNSGFAIFADIDESESLHEMTLAGDLHGAIAKGQLELHYQPVVDLGSGTVSGAEALLRWNHPEFDKVDPMVFIPLAERNGEIEALTLWTLDSVLGQCHAWDKMGLSIPISVNISAVVLHNSEFSNQVAALLDKWQVSVDQLKLEITESAIISDAARATETVTQLSAMGVRISIDDFGTGYTSIAYLRRLPVVEVKVDKSYVLKMRDNSDDAVIVCSIIELGHNLGLKVVAEGVEDAKTMDMLAELNCDAIQGFYISRPVDTATFESWITESSWAPNTVIARAQA